MIDLSFVGGLTVPQYCNCCLLDVSLLNHEGLCSDCSHMTLPCRGFAGAICDHCNMELRVIMANIILEDSDYAVIDSNHNEQIGPVDEMSGKDYKQSILMAYQSKEAFTVKARISIAKCLVREHSYSVVMKENKDAIR